MFSKIAVTLGGLFLMFVLAVAVGLGVWAYGLNTQLGKVNAELKALQTTHDKLNTDYSDLSTDSSKTNEDLAVARTEIQSLKNLLQIAQADSAAHEAKLSAIEEKVSVLYVLNFATEAAIEAKVKASEDEQLLALWAKAQKSNSDKDYWNVWDYVVQAIADEIGVGMSSNVSVTSG